MIEAADIGRIGQRLAGRGEPGGPAIWDARIDAEADLGDAALLAHVRHQALTRAYQSRYVLLPTAGAAGNVVEQLSRRYDPRALALVEAARSELEDQLIAPAIERARAAALGSDWKAHADHLLRDVRAAPENPFTAFLRTSPNHQDHYRNFLLQSSADLLAEASASALGVVGEFGPAQSALFRILIDEFGYGTHDRKHSVLYRAVMRGFGLPDEYNACWKLFDTAALRLHNTIHCLFQNPRHLFLQVGFLLHAETAYQRSTRDHFRYLSEVHPDVDARYFGEHAHIDLHHTRMVIEDVAAPLVAMHGP
ncbi:MAG: iron-containing redox enzyme family protein, partial [Phenylobacterium sp.]